ncbi:MAG TPA: DUF4440 domain-containing protein [Gemmatimonadaceae bacterium]
MMLRVAILLAVTAGAGALASHRPVTSSALARAAPRAMADAAAPACGARAPMSDSSAIAFERAWARAASARDTAALRCMLDTGFVDTNWRGALRTPGDLIAAGNAAPALAQHYQDWTVQRFDSTAIVRGLNVVTGSSGAGVARVRFTDVLRYRSGRWWAEAAQETVVPERAR